MAMIFVVREGLSPTSGAILVDSTCDTVLEHVKHPWERLMMMKAECRMVDVNSGTSSSEVLPMIVGHRRT